MLELPAVRETGYWGERFADMSLVEAQVQQLVYCNVVVIDRKLKLENEA